MKHYVGCNYWGSKWGTEMWAHWEPESVENDLKELKKYGVNSLRVFPIWRDFQPLVKAYGWRGSSGEYRLHENGLMTDEFGLDKDCMKHFSDFCDMAEKYDIRLVVSIMTGWMSGRLYMPPALYNKNLITDPEALMLEGKFIKGFVRAFKNRSIITAWDLGNECNNLGIATTRAEAYTWTTFIRNAIYAEDNTREIMSGMHGLTPFAGANPWGIQDQGEICDIMCVHPYASPSVGGNIDPESGLRTTMIPTAQMEFYSHIGGKPCMIQEQGGFGDMVGDQACAADFMRVNLRSGWANDSLGYFWWCAHEQTELNFPPYSWSMLERELGMLNVDLSPKAVALEMKKFCDVLEKLPLQLLPKKKTDAVIIVNANHQNWWADNATSYILAKEAGFDVRFADRHKPLPDAKLYIIPCISDWTCLPKECWDDVKKRVENGATMYISVDDGLLTESQAVLGLTSKGYRKTNACKDLTIDGITFTLHGKTEFLMQPLTAEVLAYDQNGNVLFSKNKYGKGEVYYMGAPFEDNVWASEDMPTPDKTPYHKLYQIFGDKVLKDREMISKTPEIGITLHPENENSIIAVAVNYSHESKPCNFWLQNGWAISEVLYGDVNMLTKGEMLVLRLKKSI